ncbi:MAG: putative cysteine proteinase [Streblomastix strix]|uniref:Putative cysteine proteinase n=1 Tax=Streblomastix strix TaxID=222440 RepID=A0A5J4VPK1_9EUKA|nr:MAG: putative cysteine proteinase [Streblomastix strix]
MRRVESPTKNVQIPAHQVQEMAPVFSIDQFVRFPSKRSKLAFGDPFKVFGLEWEILLGFNLVQYKDSITVKLNCLTLENCKTPYSKNILVRITVLSRNPKNHQSQSEYFTFSNEKESNGWNRFLDENAIFNPGYQFIQQDPRNQQQQGLNFHLEMLTEHISKHQQGTNIGYTTRNEIGMVGLINQGATLCLSYACLINLSLFYKLIIYFHFTNELILKKSAIKFKVLKQFSFKTRFIDKLIVEQIAEALQRVFFDLQTSNQCVPTKELTQSFGWTQANAFEQHDVQELNRVLMEKIIEMTENTPFRDCIPALFQVKMLTSIHCIDVKFESAREETAYDINLAMQGCRNLYESLDGYVASELLQGDNCYFASDEFGMQRAQKQTIFTKFPPVLNFQIQRQSFDGNTGEMEKINERYEFPTELDLSKYIGKINDDQRAALRRKAQENGEINQKEEKSSDRKGSDRKSVSKIGDAVKGVEIDQFHIQQPPLDPEIVKKFSFCLRSFYNSSQSGEEGKSQGGSSSKQRQSSSPPSGSKNLDLQFYPKDKKELQKALTEDQDNKYILHSVFVHSGSAKGGHYYVFVRQFLGTGKWFKLNDTIISEATEYEAVQESYGGWHQITDSKGIRKQELNSANAYMLVYLKIAFLRNICIPVINDDAPLLVREAILQKQVERKQMRFRLFTQQSVQLGAIDSLLSPGDHIFEKSRALPVKVKVDPKQTLFELREHIASATSIPSSKQRLWVMIERGTGNSSEENYWPCCLLEPLESSLQGVQNKIKQEQEQSEVALLFPEFKSRIYLEELEQTDNLPTEMDPKPFIVAVWLFDKLSKKFSFLSITSVLPNFYSFEAILPTIQQSAGMSQSQILQQMAMNGLINSETLQLFQISALTGRILQELQWQQDIHETVSNNDSKKDLEQPFHIVIQLRPTPEEFAADKTCNAFNYQLKKDNEISVKIIEILSNGEQQFPGEKISIDRDAFTEDLRKAISAKFHMYPQNIKIWRDKYSFYETGKFEKKTKIMTERVEVALNSTETVGILVNFSPQNTQLKTTPIYYQLLDQNVLDYTQQLHFSTKLRDETGREIGNYQIRLPMNATVKDACTELQNRIILQIIAQNLSNSEKKGEKGVDKSGKPGTDSSQKSHHQTEMIKDYDTPQKEEESNGSQTISNQNSDKQITQIGQSLIIRRVTKQNTPRLTQAVELLLTDRSDVNDQFSQLRIPSPQTLTPAPPPITQQEQINFSSIQKLSEKPPDTQTQQSSQTPQLKRNGSNDQLNDSKHKYQQTDSKISPNTKQKQEQPPTPKPKVQFQRPPQITTNTISQSSTQVPPLPTETSPVSSPTSISLSQYDNAPILDDQFLDVDQVRKTPIRLSYFAIPKQNVNPPVLAQISLTTPTTLNSQQQSSSKGSSNSPLKAGITADQQKQQQKFKESAIVIDEKMPIKQLQQQIAQLESKSTTSPGYIVDLWAEV